MTLPYVRGAALGPPLLVDAHVHYHEGFDQRAFFDAAAAHVANAAAHLTGGDVAPGAAPGAAGCLCFTESAGARAFERFRAAAARPLPGGWSFARTEEDVSLLALRAGAPPLVLVAGRQVATREGLEVLALGAGDVLPDGRPLAETVADVRALGALAVLPWGFGKWWGRRGRLLDAFLADWIADGAAAGAGGIFLGDNGGRLALGPRPRMFERAAARGLLVLPGSDPLPFPAQDRRPGSYGFMLDTALDARRPFARLRSLLTELRIQPCTFGRLETLPRFVSAQVRMQLHKRRRPRTVPVR